jgi:hypothetical protein
MSDQEPRGDAWKDTVSNPGHEHGLPIRPRMINVQALFGRDVVEFRDTTNGCSGFIRASEAVNLEDVR